MNQMMNSRQATLDAMWGVESQSSQGGEPAAVADGEQVADEDGDDESASGDSMDVLDKAKALQQAANKRQKHLDAMWGVESQSSAP